MSEQIKCINKKLRNEKNDVKMYNIRLIKSCSSIGICSTWSIILFQIGIVINDSLAAHRTYNKDEGKITLVSVCWVLGVLLDTYFNNLPLASSTRAIYVMCDVYIIYIYIYITFPLQSKIDFLRSVEIPEDKVE
jgi:hypothetical protein